MSTLRARSDGSEATDVSLYHTLFYSRCAFLCMLLSYPSVIISILASGMGSESQTDSEFGGNLSVFARQAHNSNGMMSCFIPCTESCHYCALRRACRHSSVVVRTNRRWHLPAMIGDGVAGDAMHLSRRRRQCVMRRSSFVARYSVLGFPTVTDVGYPVACGRSQFEAVPVTGLLYSCS